MAEPPGSKVVLVRKQQHEAEMSGGDSDAVVKNFVLRGRSGKQKVEKYYSFVEKKRKDIS